MPALLSFYCIYFSRTGNCTGRLSEPCGEIPDIEGAAGFFLLFLFQIKEVQITEIIFKIVTGSFNNILIDLTGDLCISDSEDLQKS